MTHSEEDLNRFVVKAAALVAGESAEEVLIRNAAAMAPRYDFDEWHLVEWVRHATPLAREVNALLHDLPGSTATPEQVDVIVKRIILAHLKAWMNAYTPIYGTAKAVEVRETP